MAALNTYQIAAIARKTGVDPTKVNVAKKPISYRLIETREGKILGTGSWALLTHIKKHHKAANPTAQYRIEGIFE